MGMFDDLRCEHPLPDEEVQNEWFQTKSLGCNSNSYIISNHGCLVKCQRVSFTGDITFYRLRDGKRYQYVATFIEGQLQQIESTDKSAKTLKQLQSSAMSVVLTEPPLYKTVYGLAT